MIWKRLNKGSENHKYKETVKILHMCLLSLIRYG